MLTAEITSFSWLERLRLPVTQEVTSSEFRVPALPPQRLETTRRLHYTAVVRNKNTKVAASLLLLLMVLDLSTARICSAGTLSGFRTDAKATLSATSQTAAAPAQNLDDDGCFCCCTHVLPGFVSVLAPPVPATAVYFMAVIGDPSALPQIPFRPPKL